MTTKNPHDAINTEHEHLLIEDPNTGEIVCVRCDEDDRL